MERLFLCFFLVCCQTYMIGQVTNEGAPYSWDHEGVLAKRNIRPVVMKPFDLNKIHAEDKINDAEGSKPWRFGYEFEVDLGLNTSGTWDNLSDGSRVWRINIISKGAKTLNFVFDTYRIPRGASIYLYNDDRSDVLGAYTNIFNNPNNVLGTWLVEGENVWIEYYEPVAVKGQGKLTIGKVVHGYRTVSTFETSNKNLNSSGNCNEDVNCDIGPDFQDLKNKLKKAVGLMVVGSSGFCTGTLINNTNNDKAPYFLTANHCSGGEASWAFRFNWISTNVVCSAPSNSISNGPDNFYQTTSGARILAKNPESDFELVEITGGLDNEWDIDWSGWDRTGGVPQRAMGIHHPMGDIMKTCREDQPLVKIRETVPGVSDGQPIQVWGVEDWDFGVTERGSSGSALFDEKGRLIGQLAGGAAGCVGTNDNDAPDFYGRFDVSWSFGSTDSSRLSNWLDPSNTGRKVLDILSQELIDGGGVTPPVMEEEILVYNDSPSNLKITNEANRILDYIVFDVFGKEIASGRLVRDDESIDFSNNAAGVYFVYITNTADGTSFTKKVIMNKRF